MDSDTKTDLVIVELKKICLQLDERFAKVDENFDKIDERFEQIDNRFEQIDERFEQIDKRFEQIDERFEQIDNKFKEIDIRFQNMDEKLDNMQKNISGLRADNLYEHGKIYNMLTCLNSAFLRFEVEQKDTIDFLFKGNKERQEHQSIYAHEFVKLNDLVAKNSFRISNLEKNTSKN